MTYVVKHKNIGAQENGKQTKQIDHVPYPVQISYNEQKYRKGNNSTSNFRCQIDKIYISFIIQQRNKQTIEEIKFSIWNGNWVTNK